MVSIDVERMLTKAMTALISVMMVIRRPKMVVVIFYDTIWHAVLNIFRFFLLAFDIFL